MKIKMLLTVGVPKGKKPNRVEGQTYAVSDAEGKDLVRRGWAVATPEPPPVPPPPVPPKPEPRKEDRVK